MPWPVTSLGFCGRRRRSQLQRPTPRSPEGLGAVLTRLPVRRLGAEPVDTGLDLSRLWERRPRQLPRGPMPSRRGRGSPRSPARAARRRCARPGQAAGADGEIGQSVAERHALGAPAGRARWAVLRTREMAACPTSRSVRYFSLPWAPALGRAGRCFDTGEAAALSRRGHQGLLLGAARGADHLLRSFIWRSSMPDAGVRLCGWAKGCQWRLRRRSRCPARRIHTGVGLRRGTRQGRRGRRWCWWWRPPSVRRRPPGRRQ